MGAAHDTGLMRSILQRIATGPTLSKDITREEARAAMRLILEGRVDAVQAGAFLIALRMKRESDEELLGLLDALREATATATAEVETLVDVADPYDGYVRSLPIAAFLPPVLAACGIPAVAHGIESLAPKYGVTHRRVLSAAGAAVDLPPAEAAARLADGSIGWAYVDQSRYCPPLHALARLRASIVKRPALSTLETVIGPVRARGRTHLFTGYVHKNYPRIYAMLARAAGFDSALIVRGVEGGVIPALRQEGKAYRCTNGEPVRLTLRAEDFGLSAPLHPLAVGTDEAGDDAPGKTFDEAAVVHSTVTAGIGALRGERGAARDHLLVAAALCLHHLGRYPSLRAAADAVGRALDSGSAWERFRAGAPG
ncbi:MAG TPA: hypothetical protein VIL43_13140 [Burkholderiales bacterium]